MQRILLFFGIVFLTVAAIGCNKSQVVKDSWKFTTRQYRAYLNTPASIDMEDKGSCELYEIALGESVLTMDTALQKLSRAMENSDHNPDQRWVMDMMRRFPWLSGVALVDGQGNIVAKYPEHYSKALDVKPLLEPDPKQRLGALRAWAQLEGESPEIYLANPVFGGDEMKGLIVAHFDVRSLVTLSSNPGSFMLACPQGVLWNGEFSQGTIVNSVNWNTLLTEKSCGVIGPEGGAFFWTTHYIGNLPLVYALPTTAGRHSPPEPAAAMPQPGEEPAAQTAPAEQPMPPAVSQQAASEAAAQ